MMVHFGFHALKAQCQPKTVSQPRVRTQAGMSKLLTDRHLLWIQLKPTMGPDSPMSIGMWQEFDKILDAN
jgi:hypothetical protein